MEHDPVAVGLGTVFVVVNSMVRFNTPSTNRSSTTAVRYFISLFLYCTVAVATYLIVVEGSAHTLESLIATAPPGVLKDTALKNFADPGAGPLVAALLLTVLLPNIPLLSLIDRWIFTQFQAIAAIPFEVRRLSAELRRRGFRVSLDLQEQTRRRLEEEGFDDQDIRFEPGAAPAQVWSTVTALFLRVEEWETDHRTAAYIEEFGDTLKALRTRRQGLVPKARICLKLVRDSAGVTDTERSSEAVKRYAIDFSEQVTLLKDDLIDFVSRGILHSEITDTGRNRRLSAIGFTPERILEVLTLNQMMALFCLIGALLIAPQVVLANQASSQPLSHGAQIVRIIMIALIYSAAVACAVLPKEEWSIARRQPPTMERPVVFYVLAGLMAVGISQAIGLVFNCLLEMSLTRGLERSGLTYPWSLLTFVTALGTAFLVDDIESSRLPRRVLRVLEGLSLAIIMCATTVIVCNWLRELSDAHPFPGYSPPPLKFVLPNSALIGFFIGYLVPTWYREAPRRLSAALAGDTVPASSVAPASA